MYDPANHESLSESQWSEEEARDAVAAIVAEAESAWNPRSWWPLHPVDQDEDGAETAPEAVLFCGASGVVWALDALRRAGYGVSLDLRTAARDVLENLPEKDFSWNRTSYFVGEVGPLAVAALLFDDAAARDELAVRIRENVGNRAHELFTGTPGGMNVARFVFEKTGDGRFFDAYAASLDALWEAWIRGRARSSSVEQRALRRTGAHISWSRPRVCRQRGRHVAKRGTHGCAARGGAPGSRHVDGEKACRRRRRVRATGLRFTLRSSRARCAFSGAMAHLVSFVRWPRTWMARTRISTRCCWRG